MGHISKDYPIMGLPTITVKVFRDALAHRNSPAIDGNNAGIANILYDVCIAWNVNPAVALAFFLHESNMGREGYATKTKNWGNLRSGKAELKNDGQFAYYSSWVVGLDDWCRLITGDLYVGAGLTTVSKVTPRYAPSADSNDPTQYADAVNAQVAAWEQVSNEASG
jgi:hypothetical protein